MLNDDELILSVLDLHPSKTRKNSLRLLPLSLYSSELKGFQQTAKLLIKIYAEGMIDSAPHNAKRYFNSLFASGLVRGSYDNPSLTPGAAIYLELEQNNDSSVPNFWNDHGAEIEEHVCRNMLEWIQKGGIPTGHFAEAWRNVSRLIDNVDPDTIDEILDDPQLLWFLFRVGSAGWEATRYLRLPPEEQTAFKTLFESLELEPQTGDSPAILSAKAYRKSGETYQQDIRIRIQAFMKAFIAITTTDAALFALFDKSNKVRGSVAASITIPAHEMPHANALTLPRQLIVSGCPGSGKSYYLDQVITESRARVVRTQFHAETSAYDFIGAYKPFPLYEPIPPAELALTEPDNSPSTRGIPHIDYRFVPGPLLAAFTEAHNNPTSNVVLIIEEINRGNAPAIFGDFFQLLDRTPEGDSRYGIHPSTELEGYLGSVGVALEDGALRLPGNLYIWGTMNSADQGVFPLDTAFRRRWAFSYLGFAEDCMYPENDRKILYAGESYDWNQFRSVLNTSLLRLGIHEDKLIGPYFLTISQLQDPESILHKLFYYLWDDVLRFRQSELFNAESFAQVSLAWRAGKGAPLNLSFATDAIGPADVVAVSSMNPSTNGQR